MSAIDRDFSEAKRGAASWANMEHIEAVFTPGSSLTNTSGVLPGDDQSLRRSSSSSSRSRSGVTTNNKASSKASNDAEDAESSKANTKEASTRSERSQSKGASNSLANIPPNLLRSIVHLRSVARVINLWLGLFTWTYPNRWLNSFVLCIFWIVCLHPQLFLVTGVPLTIWLLIYNAPDVPTDPQVGAYASEQRDTRSLHLSKDLIGSAVSEVDQLKARIEIVRQAWLVFYYRLGQIRSESFPPNEQAATASRLARVILWPILLVILCPSRLLVLLIGTLVLSWHSPALRVTRIVLSRSTILCSVFSMLTGLRLGGWSQEHRQSSLLEAVQKQRSDAEKHKKGKRDESVIFSYSICENQRKWIGIGWTASLFPNERVMFYDEIACEPCPAPDKFELPKPKVEHLDASTIKVTRWVWVDPEWVPVVHSKEPEPKTDDDGWMYMDNHWKHPAPRPDLTKYTRSRTHIRSVRFFEEEQKIYSSGSDEPDTRPSASPAGTLSEDVAGRESSVATSEAKAVLSADGSEASTLLFKSLRNALDEHSDRTETPTEEER